MKIGDLVEVITRPIGHMYLRKYIGTKHKIISIVEVKIYLDNIDEEDLRRYEKLYYWERELTLVKDNEPQILKGNNKEQCEMELVQKRSPSCSTVINGLLEIDCGCDNDYTIDISGEDVIDLLKEYDNNHIKLTIERI